MLHMRSLGAQPQFPPDFFLGAGAGAGAVVLVLLEELEEEELEDFFV